MQAKLNRHKAELKFGTHRNAELLGEWKSTKDSSFEFEVLDELYLDENSNVDPMEELQFLNEMWISKFKKSGTVMVSI